MVQYACSHKNVIAILGCSASVTVHDLRSTECWRVEDNDLDFKNFTTRCYDFETIRRHLNVSAHQYHMFSAMLMIVGTNDAIISSAAQSNHQRIWRVLELVQRYCPQEFYADFRRVAQMVFVDDSDEYGVQLETQYNRLVHPKDFNFYSHDVYNQFPYLDGYQWKIMMGEMICVTLPFDDFTLQQTGRQSMADLRVTLNRKAMGLLFHSKSDGNVTRKMLLKRSREDKPAVIEVEPEYPKCKNELINVV